ncbi:MAG TPA: hypothetical protein VF435_00865, partial [Pyrinomonadaceae bacterium]
MVHQQTQVIQFSCLQKYLTFHGPAPKTETYLSDPTGWQSKNTTVYKAMGDYMKGGYYFHNGTMNFVAVWPQVP